MSYPVRSSEDVTDGIFLFDVDASRVANAFVEWDIASSGEEGDTVLVRPPRSSAAKTPSGVSTSSSVGKVW